MAAARCFPKRTNIRRDGRVRDRVMMAIPHTPARLYLDQKDWIALSRLRLGRRCSEQVRRNGAALASGFDTGHLILPFSESHVLETGAIGRPTQRQDVAMTIVLLSRRHALAPLHALWTQEADAFLERRFGASIDSEPQPFGQGLTFALGFAEHELKLPWTADTPESDIALAEMYAIAEPERIGLSSHDVERYSRWERWADFFTSTSKALIEDRHNYNEQDRVAALTGSMVNQTLIGRAIGHGVQDEFLEFLREAGPWAAIQEMPSLAVLTELLRARYPDAQARWTRNDYHDVHFLSVALAYCDAVCPDRRWADLAARSEYIVNRGTAITTGEDAVERAIETLFGQSLISNNVPDANTSTSAISAVAPNRRRQA